MTGAAALLGNGCGGSVESDAARRAGGTAGRPGIGGAVGSGGVPGGDGMGGCQPRYLPCHDCGDGWVDSFEACDDGNLQPGDGCNRICQVEANWDCPGGRNCQRLSYCGDGLVGAGEICDDGSVGALSVDGCSRDCKSVDTGWYCPFAGAPCRRVGATSANVDAGAGCSVSDCPATCGNGVVEATEECDLGLELNQGDYGGCARDCRLGPRCGDGEVNSPAEECDLGSENVARYGDVEPSCTPGCTAPHFCGDGIADIEFGEQCDLGERNGGLEQPCGQTCLVVDMQCMIACY